MNFRKKYVVVTLFITLFAVAGVYVFSPGAVEKRVEPVPGAQINGNYKRVFFANFEQDLDKFKPPRKSSSSPVHNRAQNYIEVKGMQVFQGARLIPVDPAKLYYMKLEYALPVDQNPSEVKLLVGFITFDANKKIQKSGTGPYRYFVSNGRALKVGTKKNNEWEIASGIITDTGKGRRFNFRPDSRYVSPYLITNYKNKGAVTRLRYLEVLEFE